MTPPVYTPPSSAPFVPPSNAPIVSGQALPGGATYSPVGPEVVYAAQANWFISFANGNDTNDGSAAHPLKTMAEWTRRTRGLTPTVAGVIWVQVLDTDPANPYAKLICAYARIPATCMLWASGVATAVPGTVTTIGTYRAENIATRTCRAVTCPAIASFGTYFAPSIYRIRDLTNGSRAFITAHTTLEAANTAAISAPYAPITPAVRVVRPTNATEMVVGHAIQVETLTSIGGFEIDGTVLEGDPNPFWNTANPSYSGGDSCRILIQDFMLGGNVVTNDFATLWGAPSSNIHGGQGQVWYDGCIAQTIELGATKTGWWACQTMGATIKDGWHQFYGTNIGNGWDHSGGRVTLSDCFIDGAAFGYLRIYGSAYLEISGNMGGALHVPLACFDGNGIGKIFDIEAGGTVDFDNTNQVYGTGNTYGFKCYSGAFADAFNTSLGNFYCTVGCVQADGLASAPNTTGTFNFLLNPATGAGVFDSFAASNAAGNLTTPGQFYSPWQALATTGTITPNWDKGSNARAPALTGNVTIAAGTNPRDGGEYAIKLVTIGANTVGFNAAYKGVTAAVAAKTNVWTFLYDAVSAEYSQAGFNSY